MPWLWHDLFRYRMTRSRSTLRPALRPKIVKKKTNKFVRFQADLFKRMAVSPTWHHIVRAMSRFFIKSRIRLNLCNQFERRLKSIYCQQSWRKPHGMDGRFRRHFKGTPAHVKIGYGSNSKTRFLMPDGFLKVRCDDLPFSWFLRMTVWCKSVPSFECQGIGAASHA